MRAAWIVAALAVLAVIACQPEGGAAGWSRDERQAQRSAGSVAGSGDAGSLKHEVYIFQRAWTEPVRQAVSGRGAEFAGLHVLAGEIEWLPRGGESSRDASGARESVRHRLVLPAYDAAAMQSAGRPVTLVLRVGPIRGRLVERAGVGGRHLDAVLTAAERVRDEAAAAGLAPAAVQLDFDAAESQLGAYAVWVRAVRDRLAPTPVTVTALPAWLDRAAFAEVAAASAGFVLQVHSLERPTSPTAAMTLCDPAAARAAADRAARLGVPFQLALPTYGYVVVFDSAGRLTGLGADGAMVDAKSLPAGSMLRPLMADHGQLAALVADLKSRPPAHMTGVVWYRLPVDGERLNWPMQTLLAVMGGTAPAPRLEARAEESPEEPGLVVLQLANTGDAPAGLNRAIRVTLGTGPDAAPIRAFDGAGGFALRRDGPRVMRLLPSTTEVAPTLAPGKVLVVGWVRLGEGEDQKAWVLDAE